MAEQLELLPEEESLTEVWYPENYISQDTPKHYVSAQDYKIPQE